VLLPAVEALLPTEPAEQPTERRERPRTGTIVLVEDEADLRDAVLHVLREAGYDVRTYATPATALRAAAGWSPTPDLLLSDVLMPGLAGPDLAVQLREVHPGLRVVLMSGYADAFDRNLPDGSTVDLLEKPFSTDELLALLDRTLAT
jgi:DNA-binding NtrC family response regulator